MDKIGSKEWVTALSQEEEFTNLDNAQKTARKNFLDQYGIDILRSYSYKNCLNKVFLHNDPSTLCYKLEYDPDLSMFGGIHKDAYQYGLYYSKDNSWVFGYDKNSAIKIRENDAKKKARSIVANLIKGYNCISKYKDKLNNIKNYSELYGEFKKCEDTDELEQLWVLKYYQMAFPDIFQPFYSSGWQRRILNILGLPWDDNDSLFVRIGKITLAVKELGVSNFLFYHMVYRSQKLDNYFFRLASEYPDDEERGIYSEDKKKRVSNHPYAFLMKDVENYFKDKLIDKKNYYSKASAGDRNNFAIIPWIGIKSKIFKDSFQKNIYIIYLFSHDMQRVYLTINQGVNEIEKKYSGSRKTENVLKELKSNASNYCSQLKGDLSGVDLCSSVLTH